MGNAKHSACTVVGVQLVNIVMSALSDIKGNGHMTDNIAHGAVKFM